jgi:hypothetical protein
MANAHRQAFYIIIYNNVIFFFEDFLFGEATKQEKGGYHTYIEKTGLTCMSGLLLVRARLIKHEENNTAVDSRIISAGKTTTKREMFSRP